MEEIVGTKTHTNWRSNLGAVLATAGFSIGFGNIWRFPYLTGTNGGGAFVLVYFISVLLVGAPMMMVEVALGRKSQSAPIPGSTRLFGAKSPWRVIGLAPNVFMVIAWITFSCLKGWIIGYAGLSLIGAFRGVDVAQATAMFKYYQSNPLFSLGTFFAFEFICWYIVGRGLQKGIEKYCSWMLPALFIMLILLAVRSLTLPGAMAGLVWYLKPNFSVITGQTFLIACGQVFFSIGIGMAAGWMYGSYMDRTKSNVVKNIGLVAIMDTAAALLAGLVIFPAVFAYGLEPTSGTSLLFVTMTTVFSKMTGGAIFGAIFFVLVVFAALTSEFAGIETLAANIREMSKKDVSRMKAVTIVTGASFLLGIPLVFSYVPGAMASIRVFGMTLFETLDYVANNIFLMIGPLFMAFYLPIAWKWNNFVSDINVGTEGSKIRIYNWMKPLFCYALPIWMIYLTLNMFGIL